MGTLRNAVLATLDAVVARELTVDHQEITVEEAEDRQIPLQHFLEELLRLPLDESRRLP
jgi:hypothetical protein